jgi:alkanesulfonate monooxygenase SsuD/methylene tetrahydromethanopterin reductase-like flavin-dependent oxidoreductase (luciferase family)
MVGSSGPRMLEVTLPHVEQWNTWYRQTNNSPAGLEPMLRDVDEICRRVGRDPSTLEKTSAVLLAMSGGSGRVTKYDDGDIAPVEGTSAAIAAQLREYADLGVAEVQLVVDPITLESVQALAPVLADLDRG